MNLNVSDYKKVASEIIKLINDSGIEIGSLLPRESNHTTLSAYIRQAREWCVPSEYLDESIVIAVRTIALLAKGLDVGMRPDVKVVQYG